MPLFGSSAVDSPILLLPSLPFADRLSTLSCTCSLEDFPTLSASYENLVESEGEEIFEYFAESVSLVFRGMSFVSTTTSYSKKLHELAYGQKIYYSIRVQFESIKKQPANKEIDLNAIADFSAGAIAFVPISEIAATVGLSYSGPLAAIRVEQGEQTTITLQDAMARKARVLGCYSYFSGTGLQVELRSLDSGSSFSFEEGAIAEDSTNSVSPPKKMYGTKISWFDEAIAPPSLETSLLPPIFTLEPATVETTTTGDADPESPPEGSLILQDLSSCFTHSGPTLTRVTKTTINDNTLSELTEVFGFAYTMKDIDAGDGFLYHTNPSVFWRKIEERTSIYTWESVEAINYSVTISAVFGSSDLGISFLDIAPGYEDFLSIVAGDGPTASVSPSAKYLTKIETSGWKLCQHEKESSDRNTLFGPEDPYYFLFQFEVVPLAEETRYKLKPLREVYPDSASGLPFEYKIKPQFLINPDTGTYLWPVPGSIGEFTYEVILIGELKPIINYTEPLYVEIESRSTSALSVRPDPDADPASGYFLPPKITGEEGSFQVIRTVTGKPTYLEQKKEYSSQDPNFTNYADNVHYTEVAGQPPLAQSYIEAWTVIEPDPEETEEEETEEIIYFVSSTDIKDGDILETGDRNYPEAYSLEEALQAAHTDLAIANLSQKTLSKKLQWDYPSIRDGSFVDISGELIDGNAMVKSVSWGFTRWADKWVSTGTQIELGVLLVEELEVTEVAEDEEIEILDPFSTPVFEVPESTVEVSISSTSSVELGSSIILYSAGRRNFGSPYLF